LALEALKLCRTIKPVPHTTEARLLSILASAHLANNEWDLAIAAYKEAIEAAGDVYDLRRLALLYGGICDAYREIGQVDMAVRFANRSLALLEVLRDQLNLARVENNLGLILLAKGDAAQAREHLDRSLTLHDEADLEIGRSHVLLSLSELNLREGNVARARELAHQALDLAERLEERTNIAESHIWLALAADRDGDDDTADREFQLAIAELTAIGAEERLLTCHGRYAEILERRGEMDKAYAHMKKAFAASRPGMLHHDDEAEETASLA
jgi:tetratricopeptide (TPR) repeat protein